MALEVKLTQKQPKPYLTVLDLKQAPVGSILIGKRGNDCSIVLKVDTDQWHYLQKQPNSSLPDLVPSRDLSASAYDFYYGEVTIKTAGPTLASLLTNSAAQA